MKRLSKKQLRTIVGAYPWKPWADEAPPIGFEVYRGDGGGKFKVIQRHSTGFGTFDGFNLANLERAVAMFTNDDTKAMLKALGVKPSKKRLENLGYWLDNAYNRGYNAGHKLAEEQAKAKYSQNDLLREAIRTQAQVIEAVTQAGANFANLVRSFHGNL